MFRFAVVIFASLALSVHCSAQSIVPPGQHAHRRMDGQIIVHSNANMNSSRAHAGVASPWIRIAEAGQMIPGGGSRLYHPSQFQPYVVRIPTQNYSNSFEYQYGYQYQTPSSVQRQIISPSRSVEIISPSRSMAVIPMRSTQFIMSPSYSGGCPGGNCPNSRTSFFSW